jgi:FRG domain
MTTTGSEREIATGVWEHRFDNPVTFLEALQPLGELWPQPSELIGSWIFRGHADADWTLSPSAHRNSSWIPFKHANGAPFTPETSTHKERVVQEKALLREFYDAIDVAGLSPPIDRQVFDEALADPDDEWPRAALVPTLALAQHYGVPTRLLDWTRHGRIAAYFAALDGTGGPDLAVWGLDGRFLKDAGARGYAVNCHVETAPRASNPNLHAQAGLFTYVRFRQDLPPGSTHNVPLMNLDSLVAKFADGSLHMASGSSVAANHRCVMRKLVLPRSHVEVLLGMLHLDGVSALTMFPGLGGIASYLREQRRIGMPRSAF